MVDKISIACGESIFGILDYKLSFDLDQKIA